MTRSYIAAHDGTERGADAVALARALARCHGAPVRVVHVCAPGPPWPVAEDHPWRVERAHAAEIAEALRLPGDPLPLTVCAGSAAEGLHDVAEREGAELIVLGSAGPPSRGRATAGETAQRLLHGAPCAVAIAPYGYARRAGDGLGTIAVAVDDGSEARAALRRAADLARRLHARLLLLTAVDVATEAAVHTGLSAEDLEHAIRGQAEDLLHRAQRDLPVWADFETRVCVGEPGRAIAAACDDGVDLLICGSRSYGPPGVVLLGSVTSYLVTHVHCPVLVVPRMGRHGSRVAEREPAAPKRHTEAAACPA
jgi:nucleotide-binding universal stress UspA family protein